MSSIDQSLDDIISAHKPRASRARRTTKGASGVRKASVSTKVAKRGTTTRPKSASKPDNAKSSSARSRGSGSKAIAPGVVGDADAASTVRRIVISNLPRETSEPEVREFLQDRVGAVTKVVGAFNQHGTSTGSYTVTFRNQGSALKALQTLHNSPVDGGSRQLRVELLFEASSNPATRSLKDRIGLPSAALTVAKAARASGKAAARSRSNAKPEAIPVVSKAKANGKTANAGNAKANTRAKRASAKGAASEAAAPKAAAKKATKKRNDRPAKTAEELDAEMDDYFANNSEPEIA